MTDQQFILEELRVAGEQIVGFRLEKQDYPADQDGHIMDEDDFQPCAECDGHDACRDFGCAIKLGLGHMVKIPY